MFCPGEIREHSITMMVMMMMKLMMMVKISEYLQYADYFAHIIKKEGQARKKMIKYQTLRGFC